MTAGGVQLVKTKLKSYEEQLIDMKAKGEEIQEIQSFFSLNAMDPGRDVMFD